MPAVSPPGKPGTTRNSCRSWTRSGCPPATTHASTRTALRCKGIAAVIPERTDQIQRRAARASLGGRPPAFDAETYKLRNVVERAFNRLKQWHGNATCYECEARNYRTGIVLAAVILFWLT